MSLSRWFAIGAILLFLAVALGAFGAHALKEKLDSYSLGVYDKAFLYHVIHALGILAIVLGLKANLLTIKISLPILTFGTVLFSGSLYLLAITGIKWLGAITPVGGTMFLIGWATVAYDSIRR